MFCFNRLHWEPSKFNNLEMNEKAVVIAMIDHIVKQEKKEAKKMN